MHDNITYIYHTIYCCGNTKEGNVKYVICKLDIIIDIIVAWHDRIAMHFATCHADKILWLAYFYIFVVENINPGIIFSRLLQGARVTATTTTVATYIRTLSTDSKIHVLLTLPAVLLLLSIAGGYSTYNSAETNRLYEYSRFGTGTPVEQKKVLFTFQQRSLQAEAEGRPGGCDNRGEGSVCVSGGEGGGG